MRLYVDIVVPRFILERRRMKALESGSSGFLGSHLREALLSREWEVVSIPRELLYNPDQLIEFVEKEKPDYIYHLAAYGNMSHQKDLAMIVFANLIGTFNLLNASLRVPYRAFINFGSSSEYGIKGIKMSETDRLDPNSMYGATKAGATHLVRAFAKQFDKPTLTVRPFSVYGPGEADYRFIPTVCRSIVTNTPFPLDEHATHDWVYIQDFTDGVLLATDNINRLSSQVVNIGSGRMHTNREVCEMLKKVSGKQYLATPLNGLRNDSSQAVWMSDNSKIASFGFAPKHMLEEGLRKTFNYFKSKYESGAKN